MVTDDSVLNVTGFTPFERDQRQRVRMMTALEIEAMVTSRSWYLLAEPQQQSEVLAGVRNLVATHPHSRGRERFEYALHSTVYRADLVSG